MEYSQICESKEIKERTMMNRKFFNIIMSLILAMTVVFSLPADTQASSYKKAYKKALTTSVSGGIYSKYAYINLKGFSKPVMMVIMNDWNSDYQYTEANAYFYYYKKGKVKKIGKITLDGEREDWKLRRKGKKYVLYKKLVSGKTYYVLVNKKGKIKADRYWSGWDSYQKPSDADSYRLRTKHFYIRNGKEISKSKFQRLVKTTKSVRLKEHFAERLY